MARQNLMLPYSITIEILQLQLWKISLERGIEHQSLCTGPQWVCLDSSCLVCMLGYIYNDVIL